jgi:hypothetical protein
MPLPQFFGKRLHRDVMAFKTTTHGQPLQGNFSESNLLKGGLKSIYAPWGRVYFQCIRTQVVKKGSQIIKTHSPIQGLNKLRRACRPTATAPVAKPFINPNRRTDGIGWTYPFART